MKKNTGRKITAILFLAVFFSCMTGYIVGVRADKKSIPDEKTNQPITMLPSVNIKNDDIKIIEKEDKITQVFVLREDNGGVSVYSKYSDGREEKYQSYDIAVSTLPQADRKMLSEGIEVQSLSEALQIIEDFS